MLPLIAAASPIRVTRFTAFPVSLRAVICSAALRKPLLHLLWQRRLLRDAGNFRLASTLRGTVARVLTRGLFATIGVGTVVFTSLRLLA